MQSLSGTQSVTPQSVGIYHFQLYCQGYQGAVSGITTLSVQVPSGSVPLAARFCRPQGLAIDASDDLYIADTGNYTIRKVTHEGVVSTVAGLAGYPAHTDGLGASARFSSPVGVAVDATGKIFVGDSGNDAIRQVTADGSVTTLAGLPGNLGNGAATDGTGAAASFWRPYAVALDAGGNVYVADYGLNAIRKVTPGGVVTTIAGVAGVASTGSADGTGAAARFMGPSGVVVLDSGDIYVADQGNNTIRKIAAGGVVTTFAGTAASFFYPSGIAIDSADNIYVTDASSAAIRKITPAGVVTTYAGRFDVCGTNT